MLSDEFVEDYGELMQSAEVGLGQPLDYAITGFGQPHADHAAVGAIRYPLDQPAASARSMSSTVLCDRSSR